MNGEQLIILAHTLIVVVVVVAVSIIVLTGHKIDTPTGSILSGVIGGSIAKAATVSGRARNGANGHG